MQPQLLTVITEEKLKAWTPEEWSNWFVEPKFDGGRSTYHKGKFSSRTGKPFHNLDHLLGVLKGINGWTLDGEIYGTNWAETMSVARASKTVKTENNLKFAVFDIMEDDDWTTQSNVEKLGERRKTLRHVLRSTCTGGVLIHPVPFTQVPDYSAFAAIHAHNLASGCDGTVLKHRDSLYEFKRTKTWLKVKPCLDADGLVVGMKEGEGKYKGMCGALEVIPEAELQGKGISTFVSGMVDEQRQCWWNHRASPTTIIGKTIEVKIRGVHPSGRWIEPRFHRIREDK